MMGFSSEAALPPHHEGKARQGAVISVRLDSLLQILFVIDKVM